MHRFRPYLKYLKPFRGRLALALACLTVYSVASGFGLPYLIPKVFKPVFDADPTRTLWQVAQLALLIPAVFVIRALSGYTSSYLFQVIGTGVLEELRTAFFRKLQALPLSYIHSQRAGDLTSRGLSDTSQLQAALTALANEGIKHPLTLLSALGAIIFISLSNEGVVLALVCLGLVPLCVFPIRYVARKVLRRAHQAQAELGSVSSQMTENLSAAREVRAFSLERRATERFAATTRALVRAQLKIAKYALGVNPVIEIISSVGIGLTLVYCYHAHVTYDVLFMLLIALYQCYEPIKKLGYLNTDLKRAIAALDRIEPVLNEPERITDPENPVSVSRLRGAVEFRGVSFSYTSETPVLRAVDASIPAGTVCALVGPSGAGKTTFVNLVPRFFEVAEGGVLLDGIDVRAMRVADLRRNIAIVSQEPVLFNDTVLNNLLLGREGATRDEVEQAARDASAHEFIEALPLRYDTMIGERGSSLSGGQKQRIALARAFLRNAPILILDEVTSALDSQSEQAIQSALKKLMVGKTVLIIAHRFSTIRDANHLLVFEKGALIAQGPHAAVYASCPLYRSLFDQQQLGPDGRSAANPS